MELALDFAERRVLGVLVEKGFTTPEQYPLTLNGLVTGCNQKSCRDPVSHLSEEQILEALDSLREKGLVTLVRSAGSRTDRFKHRVTETLELSGKEAAVLAELVLRGPQTDGELRQRASRMVAIADLPELGAVIDNLSSAERNMVARLSPPGRRRGVKYAHNFYPPGERPGDEQSSGNQDGPATAVSPEPRPVRSPDPPSPPPVAPESREPERLATRDQSPGSQRVQSTAGTAVLTADGVGPDRNVGDVTQEVAQLRGRIEKLEERVKELEDTFARFFH